MTRTHSFSLWLLAVTGALFSLGLLSGCRGDISDKPPIHLNQNMDFQKRVDPQEANSFFRDNRGVRSLIKGTVARGYLQSDTHFYAGKVGGKYASTLPKQVKVNEALLQRGKERFNIYCSTCHGTNGNGKGTVTLYARAYKPANLHDDRIRRMSVGELYHVILYGKNNNMPGYKVQIPANDRWAIIAYLRALQLTRIAKK